MKIQTEETKKHHSDKMKKWHREFGFSEETRKKMSIAQKGRKTGRIPKTAFKKGGITWNKGIKCPQISIKLKGIKRSKETKRKIGLASLGRKHSDETKKKMSISRIGKPGSKALLGKKRSIEVRKKISEGHKKIKNWNWKGGIENNNRIVRDGIETRLWREAVFARDGWTCQKTKTKGGELHAHHIQNFSKFPEFRFAIDNGITLSKKSHKEFHNQFGWRNNNTEQIQEFLKNI